MIRRSKRTAKRLRAEKKVIDVVRPQCVDRDGFCRAACKGVGPCSGVSEWAHFHSHRRSKTVNQSAESRHDRRYSFQLCTTHHWAYDAHALAVNALSDDGCDGRLAFRLQGQTDWFVEVSEPWVPATTS